MANEKRLIYADDLRQHWLENGENEHIYDTNAFLDSIDEQPTVDAVPVVHGRWEPHPRHPGFDRCSICHDCIIADDWVDGIKWSFCPQCGAKMDGGDNHG